MLKRVLEIFHIKPQCQYDILSFNPRTKKHRFRSSESGDVKQLQFLVIRDYYGFLNKPEELAALAIVSINDSKVMSTKYIWKPFDIELLLIKPLLILI